MKQFITIKHMLFALFIACASISVNAQRFKSSKSMKVELEKSSPQIEGKKSGQVGKESVYDVKIPDGVEIGEVAWSIDDRYGKIVESSQFSATILWEKTGETKVQYDVLESSRGRMRTVFNVIITADAPNIPPAPSIENQTCTSAVLQKTGTIPNGEMWYWQGTTKYGTATSAPATSNYNVIESGNYIIRAKNLSTGVWSVRGSFVEVILDENAAGQTWYADTDGDGKGDLNDTIIQCSQPTGYVLNSDDQCPTVNGGGTYNGCEAEDPSNQNYIYTITAQVPTNDIDKLKLSDDALENITYFDELGRAKQSIAIRQSPNRKDIVSHIAYDEFGRQIKEYLPYASNLDDGLLKLDALTRTNVFYNTEKYQNTSNPYSEKVIEASPLGRIHEQTAPGNDWVKGANKINGKEYSDGHTIKFEYQTNLAGEVRMFSVATTLANNTYTPSLTLNTSVNGGKYPAGTLTKTIVKDENWTVSDGLNHTTEEFKDKNGNIVLKRNYALANATSPQKHDTYYVYDDYGNLTYVLPPKVEGAIASLSSIQSSLNDLSYQYKYDHRNRLVEKKIPGKGWEYIVYDKLDRPVLTQDALLRETQDWLFTKYDKLGRVTYTGMFHNGRSRITMQPLFEDDLAQNMYEDRTSSTIVIDGMNLEYTNKSYPTDVNNLKIYTINYYDNYHFDLAGSISPAGIGEVYGKPLTNNVKGLPTGSKVRTLGTSDWTTTVNYYDEKGQPIYVYSKNEFLKTSDIIKSDLDFTGKVVETTSYHTNTNDTALGTQTVIDVFEYDHTGRLKTQKQFLANGSVYANAKITENTYDELGQLVSKGVGGDANTSSSLQVVDYTYNIRGWLTNINNVNNLGEDVFAFNIKYQDIADNSKKLFNGNISQTNWKSASANTTGNPVSNRYTYEYDALNRLKSAIDNTGNYNLNSVDYDKNGNILTLQRKGHLNANATSFGIMDDLAYTYNNGNQLTKVLDNGNDTFGFKDGANLDLEYMYDVNGNMVSDTNKGIVRIEYNHLNLPTQVELGAGKIFYTYDATGIKLEKRVEESGSITTTDYAGNYVYENDNLQFFNHAEGYVKTNVTSSGVEMSYVYQYKDHLGNVRVSYADTNNDGEINPENEIIEEKNYYAFGLLHKGYNNLVSSNGNSIAQKFGYNGIELEESFGLDLMEMDVRMYDPAIARFNGIDPVVHHSFGTSVAFDNNPVYWADPSGADAYSVSSSGVNWVGDYGPSADYYKNRKRSDNDVQQTIEVPNDIRIHNTIDAEEKLDEAFKIASNLAAPNHKNVKDKLEDNPTENAMKTIFNNRIKRGSKINVLNTQIDGTGLFSDDKISFKTKVTGFKIAGLDNNITASSSISSSVGASNSTTFGGEIGGKSGKSNFSGSSTFGIQASVQGEEGESYNVYTVKLYVDVTATYVDGNTTRIVTYSTSINGTISTMYNYQRSKKL